MNKKQKECIAINSKACKIMNFFIENAVKHAAKKPKAVLKRSRQLINTLIREEQKAAEELQALEFESFSRQKCNQHNLDNEEE